MDCPVNVCRLKTIYPQSIGYINSSGEYVGLDSSLWNVIYENNKETLRLELRYDVSNAAGSTAVIKFYSY